MMSPLRTLAVLACLLGAASAAGHSGVGTAYGGPHDMDATGQNMCEYNPSSLDDKWQVYYAAMNEQDWDAAGGLDGVCGRCIAVRGVEGETASGHDIKTVVVKIVDQCPSWACEKGSVDFSSTALEAITGYDWDKKAITWDYVDCDTGVTPAAAAAAAAAKKRAAAAAAAKKSAAAAKEAAAARAAADKVAAAARAQAAAQAAADQAAAETAIATQAAFVLAAEDAITQQVAAVDPQAAIDAQQTEQQAAATTGVDELVAAANEAVQAAAVQAAAAAPAAARRMSRRLL
jgi:pyruvate/2-oxoglutarate dehydrogenase complex dihydrolipoamide acyltransferase (E2) component